MEELASKLAACEGDPKTASEKMIQLEGMVTSMKAWLGQEIAKSAALQIERDAAVKELERQRSLAQAAGAAGGAAGGSAGAGSAHAGSVGDAAAMRKLRNELVQIQLQFELVSQRHREEQQRRAELEGERDKLAAEVASLKPLPAGRNFLEVALEAGAGSLSASPSTSEAAVPGVPTRAEVELRAQLRLQQSEYEDLRGRMTAYGDSIARERRLYEDRMAQSNSRLEEARRLLEAVQEQRAPAEPSSELAELRAKVKKHRTRERRAVEEARLEWAKEKQELLRQIDILRKVPGSFSASPSQMLQQQQQQQQQDGPSGSEGLAEDPEQGSEEDTPRERDDEPAEEGWEPDEPADPQRAQGEALASVLRELVTSEDAYVRSLRVAVEVFHKGMDQVGDQVVPRAARASIFSTYDLIRNNHEEILRRLREIEEHGMDEAVLGQIFLDIADFTKVYLHYSQNYEAAVSTIADLTIVPAFAAFLEKAHTRRVCNGLWLESFLLIPIQRVSRYLTHLTCIIQGLEGSRRDSHLMQALEKLKKVAPQLNEKKRESEAVYKVVEIQRHLKGVPPLVQQRRRFLYEGAVSSLDEKLREHGRYFYLFTDILIEARKVHHAKGEALVGAAKHKYLSTIPLHGLKVKDVPDSGSPCPNILQLTSGSQVYVIVCPSPESKIDWIMRLKGALEQLSRNERAIRHMPTPQAYNLTALNVAVTSPPSYSQAVQPEPSPPPGKERYEREPGEKKKHRRSKSKVLSEDQ